MKTMIRGIAIVLAAVFALTLFPMVKGYAAESDPEGTSAQSVIAENSEIVADAGGEAAVAAEEILIQELPAAEEAGTEEAAVEEPASEEPAAEESAAEKPAAEKPAAEEATEAEPEEETYAPEQPEEVAEAADSSFAEQTDIVEQADFAPRAETRSSGIFSDSFFLGEPLLAIREEAPFDNSTTVKDGTYELNEEDYTFEGGSGRVSWTAEKVVVQDGKATAVFTVSSDNMTHVYLGTVAPDTKEDPSIYDPETGEKGVNVYEVENRQVTVPVRLNEKVAFAGRTTGMSEPRWIQYYCTITLEDSQEDDADKEADYTAVDKALKKIPRDLTVYTEKSVAALEAAKNQVVRGKPASEQAAVDAMAKAIEDAVKELKLKPEDGAVELEITNGTDMFKVVTAYLITKDGKTELVITLSGEGYHDLFKGTYEQAVANGDNRDNWIHGKVNAAGKWEFRIPVEEGETYIPCVSISNSYLKDYEKGKCSLERAFYPRQLEINAAKKTLVTGDYANSVALTIKNNTPAFKAESALLATVGGPNSNNYSSDLLLTMGSDEFDKACYGTKEQAAASGNVYKIDGRTFKIPVRWVKAPGHPETMETVIGSPVMISFHSVDKDEWEERVFLIDEDNRVLTIDPDDEGGGDDPAPVPVPVPGDDTDKDDSDKKSTDDTGGSTAAVDNSTSLADGVYTPDKFSFSGGSGRVAISCDKVEVRGGKAYATIVFTNLKSGVTEMSYVKASGGTYYCTQVGGTSVVEIPVELNQNNTILAMTTKMSAAHEIEYTIFVYIAGADAQKGNELTENKSLDTEAPVIAGLEYTGEEKVEHAEYFKIFNYSDGIRLLEIDTRPVKDKEANKDTAAEMEKESAKSEESSAATVIDEETGAEVELKASKADAQAELYKGNVVKYLLVPENVEIPAGLDKETIVIQLPVDSVYAGSAKIAEVLKSLGIDRLITSQEKEDKDKNILGAGSYKDMDIKKLVKSKCDLVILDSESLKNKKEREIFNSLGEDLANLDIVLIVDRSEDEKTKKAQAEWLKVYGILFGCEKEAEEAYEAVQ